MKYMIKVVNTRGEEVCEYASMTHPQEGECLTIFDEKWVVALVTHVLNKYRDGSGGYYSLEHVLLEVYRR